MKVSLNMVVSNAVAACRVYEYVFEGIVGDVYEFPDRPNSNEANIIIGNLELRLIDENLFLEIKGEVPLPCRTNIVSK